MNLKSNYGTSIGVKTGTANAYSRINGAYNIPDIDNTEEQIEVTHHGSGAYRERIPSGLSDPGEYTFGLRVDTSDSVQQSLKTMKDAHTKATYQIKWPDGHYKTFDAYVTGIKRNDADATSPDGINADVTLAVAGNITEGDTSL